jgi:hypothetical protein
VVLDTNGVEPPISLRQNQNGFFEEIPGVEPYVKGTLTLYASAEGQNSIQEAPSFVSEMNIKRRGNSSMLYDKAQWLIKLCSESGQKREEDLLSMGSHDEWILNGSMMDKSLLRNYLAYWMAAQVLPYTPEVQFCEVLIRRGEQLYYNGVYLLGENIAQGKARVDIAPVKEESRASSYIIRRDRPDSGNMLNTFGKEQGLYSDFEAIGLIYPGKYRATQEMIEYVTEDVSRFERALYSEDIHEYETYSRYIDVDSFVDYFLINEFLGNYDAGNHSTYAYKTEGGKLTMGPVWDFDGALDNYYREELDYDAVAFQTKPWFDRLCLDHSFIKKLEERYLKLRSGPLSEPRVINKIDEITAHLGGAIDRDWARWGTVYQKNWAPGERSFLILRSYVDKEGDLIWRNAREYDHELLRIKSAVRRHGKEIYPSLQELHNKASFTTGISSYAGLLLLGTMLIFLTPAILAEYKS